MNLSLSEQVARIANELGGEEQDILLQGAAALRAVSQPLTDEMIDEKCRATFNDSLTATLAMTWARNFCQGEPQESRI